MKKVLAVTLLFVTSIALLKCDSKKADNMSASQSDVTADQEGEAEAEPSLPTAICIWKEVSVRDLPSEKGKYLTTVYLGEKLNVLADTASEKVSDRIYNYQRVKLVDGTEGWIRKDFLAINAVPAAFINETGIYKRPDLMTATKKNFALMDFVAIKNSTQDGWAEVVGKRTGDTWFTTAWVRKENLTTESTDVMFSVLYTKALETKDEEARVAEIQKLLANRDLNGSQFYAQINSIYGEASEDVNSAEENSAIEADTIGD